MRLGYSTLREGWTLFIVPEARAVRNPCFVDDESLAWGHVVELGAVLPGYGIQCMHHATKRILVKAEQKLVLIDPVDDEGDDDVPEQSDTPVDKPVTEGV